MGPGVLLDPDEHLDPASLACQVATLFTDQALLPLRKHRMGWLCNHRIVSQPMADRYPDTREVRKPFCCTRQLEFVCLVCPVLEKGILFASALTGKKAYAPIKTRLGPALQPRIPHHHSHSSTMVPTPFSIIIY